MFLEAEQWNPVVSGQEDEATVALVLFCGLPGGTILGANDKAGEIGGT
jgi:hypothetical protein